MSQREPECNGNTCEDDGPPEECGECGCWLEEGNHAFNCSRCEDCEPSDYAWERSKEDRFDRAVGQ